MQQNSGTPIVLLSTAGVVVVSCVVAFVIDRLLPERPRVKKVLPIIGITVNVTQRFFPLWIVSGVVVFVLSVAVGVLLSQ